MSKVFGSEFMQRLARVGMEILGLYGRLREDSRWVQLGGRFEYLTRDTVRMTITKGTNEIQRNLIATRGLGLPKG